MSEQSAENVQPFAHDDDGALIAVTCNDCRTVVSVGYDHECIFPPGQERCRVCGGVDGEHDGSIHDARVADMPIPPREETP